MTPLHICSYESRRADEMRSLIERQGAVATVAASMREVPLDQNPQAFAFAEDLLAGRVDLMVFMTGVGARSLLEVLEQRHPREAVIAAWNRGVVAVRGPKPTVVLREWGVRIDHRAPEPNTWRELLATLDAERPVAGLRVAVQEYGVPSDEFYAALRERGASVQTVPVYRWALPEDTQQLEAAIRDTVAGRHDVLLVTSAQQLFHVLAVAQTLRLREAWLEAARKTFIASIGPTATETLEAEGLRADFEPSHPKMGTLVKEVCEQAAVIRARLQG